MKEQDTLTISKEEAGIRIDKFLSEKFLLKSRTYFQYLIENGKVLVNNSQVKKRLILKEDDEIEIFFQALPEISLEPQDIPLDVIYEDDHIIAVNKPYGMVVHPAVGNWSNTFVNALLFYCKQLKNENNSLRPGIVHRLDKDTSGILIAAKTNEAHQKLIESFQKREIEKTYLAICLNKPMTNIVNLPIGRHPVKRKEMAVVETGKEAYTQLEILKYNDKLSLVQAKPKTGRTHQLRVHLKSLNCPILGDVLYGNKSINDFFKAERQLLHAYQIKFIHPIFKTEIELTAPIPDDLQKFIDLLS